MKVCLCLYVDKIWFKIVYMLYFSFHLFIIYFLFGFAELVNSVVRWSSP